MRPLEQLRRLRQEIKEAQAVIEATSPVVSSPFLSDKVRMEAQRFISDLSAEYYLDSHLCCEKPQI
ncbi:hypothetical protein NZD89_05025 [Alicyclobacillus fastidiosus]|uniref:Spo0E like sporulation regulatory protein n=1 Tax=Alicyclobacillus fastidiosus TaxID=392011 RepID=A0ABY6ZIP9_9BACL|nr:hypothetical protein [Alicyclobacillus fastidiosus]WAH42795.1 hypothetical protein NZD89_05025 [Alicyclobacillus fastidiosus]GMA64716.1 hypothetical protein GCM10025859_51560 [Alicyclobacillus fastidiosus]